MLTREQLATLESVLDAIIPPDAGRGLPGAGELGGAGAIATALERSPDFEPAIAAGLSALGPAFAARAGAARAEALSDLAASQPAFLPILVFQTYQHYYQNPKVLGALGIPPRPPHPQGYEVEPNDLTLLEPVRAMGKLYRDV